MAHSPIVMEGIVDAHAEDSGMALIAENISHLPEELDGFFVRLQSWDEKRQHPIMRSLEGKRVRVTVEVIDE